MTSQKLDYIFRYEVCHGLSLSKRDDHFRVSFDLFWKESHFRNQHKHFYQVKLVKICDTLCVMNIVSTLEHLLHSETQDQGENMEGDLLQNSREISRSGTSNRLLKSWVALPMEGVGKPLLLHLDRAFLRLEDSCRLPCAVGSKAAVVAVAVGEDTEIHHWLHHLHAREVVLQVHLNRSCPEEVEREPDQ